MKTAIFYIIFLNVITIEGYKFNVTSPSSLQCKLISNIKGQSHTMFLDLQSNSDDILKTCMIQACGLNHSILLLKGKNVSHIKRSTITANHPNVVILTESLGPEIFEYRSLDMVLESHWSVVYIIIASKDGSFYGCEDGKLNKSGYVQIETFLNDLWHVYRMMRVVVAFPFTCPEQFVVYSRKNQKLAHTRLYDRKIELVHANNLKELAKIILKSDENVTHSYPLKGNIFYRFPTCIECENLVDNVPLVRSFGKCCGFDTMIMQDVVNYFNFDIYFPDLEYCNKYGYEITEKNISHGSLGCVVRNEIDISFNSRFMEPYPDEHFYYLHYVKQDSLCVLLQQPGEVPLWHYPFNTYNMFSSLNIAVTIIVLAVMMWLIDKVMQKYTNQEVLKLHSYIINSITSTLFGFFINKKIKVSLLPGICLCLSIVLSALFQGHINYLFTTLIPFSKLVTLENLYESDVILYTSPSIKQLLKPLENSSDEQLMNFLKNVHMRQSSDFGDKRGSHLSFILQDHKVATVARKSDVLLEIQLYYMDENKRPMMYVMNECFRNYYISLIASRSFPFIKYLRQFMERLMESGLPDAYYRWTWYTFGLTDTVPKTVPEPRPYSNVTLRDDRIGFILLLIGYLVSTITFIIENWWWKRCNRR